MKPKISTLLTGLLLAAIAAPLCAHDFWMLPSSFRPAKDTLVNVALYVGDFGIGDAVERKEERTVKFIASTPDGEKKIVGRDGALPAGYLRTKSDGTYVLGFQSNHASVTLEPQKFMSYLDERGLDNIKALRAKLGEADKPVREIYSRSPKSLLQVGDGTPGGWDAKLGLTLELTPLASPQGLIRKTIDGPYTALPLRLTFQEKPIAGVLVGAINLDDPPKNAGDQEHVLHARSDESGRVSFEFPRAGRWMIAAVHMLPLEANPDADYESFWGSLTFELL